MLSVASLVVETPLADGPLPRPPTFPKKEVIELNLDAKNAPSTNTCRTVRALLNLQENQSVLVPERNIDASDQFLRSGKAQGESPTTPQSCSLVQTVKLLPVKPLQLQTSDAKSTVPSGVTVRITEVKKSNDGPDPATDDHDKKTCDESDLLNQLLFGDSHTPLGEVITSVGATGSSHIRIQNRDTRRLSDEQPQYLENCPVRAVRDPFLYDYRHAPSPLVQLSQAIDDVFERKRSSSDTKFKAAQEAQLLSGSLSLCELVPFSKVVCHDSDSIVDRKFGTTADWPDVCDSCDPGEFRGAEPDFTLCRSVLGEDYAKATQVTGDGLSDGKGSLMTRIRVQKSLKQRKLRLGPGIFVDVLSIALGSRDLPAHLGKKKMGKAAVCRILHLLKPSDCFGVYDNTTVESKVRQALHCDSTSSRASR